MSLGISLFLLAVGAVLAFAVNYTAQGVDIAAVGWILMAVGFLGVMLYLFFLASFAPFYRGDNGGTTTVVDRTSGGPGHTHV
jgi:hypothetical protein